MKKKLLLLVIGASAGGLIFGAGKSEEKKAEMKSVTSLRVQEEKVVDRAKLISLDESETADIKKRVADRRARFLSHTPAKHKYTKYRVVYESTLGGPKSIVRRHAHTHTHAHSAYRTPFVTEATTATGAPVYIPVQQHQYRHGRQYYRPSQATYRIIARE